MKPDGLMKKTGQCRDESLRYLRHYNRFSGCHTGVATKARFSNGRQTIRLKNAPQ